MLLKSPAFQIFYWKGGRWSCSADDLSHFSSLLSICLTLAKMDQKLLLLVAASSIRLTHCNTTMPSTHVETWYKEDFDDAMERFGFTLLSHVSCHPQFNNHILLIKYVSNEFARIASSRPMASGISVAMGQD